MGLAAVEGARIRLAPLTMRHPLLDRSALQQQVLRHYTRAALNEGYKVLASVDILGASPLQQQKKGTSSIVRVLGAADASRSCHASCCRRLGLWWRHKLRCVSLLEARPASRPGQQSFTAYSVARAHDELRATLQATPSGCCITSAWASGASWRSPPPGCCR